VEIQKLRSGAASSEYAAPPGLKFCWDCGSKNMSRLTALKMAAAKIILGWTTGVEQHLNVWRVHL
jgi:hypothetical protein